MILASRYKQSAIIKIPFGSQGKMSDEENPGCLGYIGDSTTQLYGDYNKPL